MKLIHAFFWIVPFCGCNSAPPAAGWSAARLSGDTFLDPSSGSPGAARQALSPAPHAAGGSTLYVNFLGDLLTYTGTDDATQDQAVLPGQSVQIPALNAKINAPKMTADEVTDAIFDRLRTFYLPFDVTLTRTRPPSGSAYTMIVVGGTHGLANQPSGVAGVAVLDCSNANPSNVVFDFSDDQAPQFGGVVSVAITAAHEAGHAYGLEHTDNPDDLMFSVDPSVKSQTLDQLFRLSFAAGNFSGFSAGSSVPATEQCGRANPLDNGAILRAALGARPAGGDTLKPTLTWRFPPANVQNLPLSIPLMVDASDDVGVQRVEVYKNLELVAALKAPPYATTITATDKESFYLTVEALDAAGNRTSVSRLYSSEVRFPALCENQAQCPAGRTCQDSYCRQPIGASCQSAFDCLSSFCKLLPAASMQTCTQACDATQTCPDGSQCDGLYCIAGTGPDGGTLKMVGAPCMSESECLSDRCTTTCVPECDDVTFCADGYTCEKVKGGHGCLPSTPVEMAPPFMSGGCTVSAGGPGGGSGLLLLAVAALWLVLLAHSRTEPSRSRGARDARSDEGAGP